MRTDGYRAWLEQREPSLKLKTVKTLITDAKRVEKNYGDLDELYGKDRPAGVLRELRYSADDARRKAPNPSKIPVPNPMSLSSLRNDHQEVPRVPGYALSRGHAPPRRPRWNRRRSAAPASASAAASPVNSVAAFVSTASPT